MHRHAPLPDSKPLSRLGFLDVSQHGWNAQACLMCLQKYGSSSQTILLLAGGQFHISKSFDASIQLITLIILSLQDYEYYHVWHCMLVLYTNVPCLQVQRP